MKASESDRKAVGEGFLSEQDLESVKSMIVDQEMILTAYADQWELMFTDLASCVKIIVQMEQKSDST